MNFLNKSLKIFTAFDIPVRIHTSILFLVAAVIMFLGLEYIALYVILFSSVIAHEFGHALTARRFGGDCKVIYIHIFGGLAMINIPRSIKAEWVVAAAGPLTSLALGLLFYNLYVWTGIGFFWLPFTLNLLIGLFNLIPVYPMDGGRIFKSVMSYFFGEQRGTEIAIWVARVIALLAASFGIYSGNYEFIILATFIIVLGTKEYNSLKQLRGWV